MEPNEGKYSVGLQILLTWLEAMVWMGCDHHTGRPHLLHLLPPRPSQDQ